MSMIFYLAHEREILDDKEKRDEKKWWRPLRDVLFSDF
jgi:hypothetical protein